MRNSFYFLIFCLIVSCKYSKSSNSQTATEASKIKTDTLEFEKSSELSAISTEDFRDFKVLDSKYLSKATIWSSINQQMEDFTEEDYNRLKPLILEKSITELQVSRTRNLFSYEELTKFYLYRIRKFDRENPLALNSVIAINPHVIAQSQLKDKAFLDTRSKHPIFGMPILLKDNINASHMATTAGAVALKDNFTGDAFIVKQLKSKDALILGKANLSEWAYYFCGDCPSGYSAIGGQTLNPYGRRIIDTGGSSSGSGVSVAANFCAAAIGSETAGSILSPASQNSVVGLKPTVGLVSRTGIVPISSTLDTAGPITKSVRDAGIVLDAISSFDTLDTKSVGLDKWQGYFTQPPLSALKGKRFGAPIRLLKDSLYKQAIKVLREQGAEIVEIEEEKLGLPNFIRLLNIDMKKDLPAYLSNYADSAITLRTVNDVILFNLKDSVNTMPYGQKLFEGITNDKGDDVFLARIKDTLQTNGKAYFSVPMRTFNLDGFLSINNYHAAFAAVAEYPALTVPMGYDESGVPKGLTFIAEPFQEKLLIDCAILYEEATKERVAPKDYN
ncbi:amidase [Winogradskyella sp. F6397]|uniref:Amidase n=1 Tax=Winogradskyella marina TaxID=2785530 RepID=A0ABS0EKZ7_9FLAO|nr:amidase family protein [Winogradskyella marina]MBF8151135.1 amidase [Winogradskyella marina]